MLKLKNKYHLFSAIHEIINELIEEKYTTDKRKMRELKFIRAELERLKNAHKKD